MTNIFSEAVLEQAIIDKFIVEGYEYVSGDDLHREMTDVLIEEDLSAFLFTKYASQGITSSEISSIIRSLRYSSAIPLYSANRNMFQRMVEGETFVREDRSAKELIPKLEAYSQIMSTFIPGGGLKPLTVLLMVSMR